MLRKGLYASLIVLRSVSANLKAWLQTLMRSPRVPSGHWKPLWPLTGRIVTGAVICILIVVMAMLLLDAGLISQLRRLPRWVFTLFDWITQLGNAGVFLWPIGILLLFIAARSIQALSPVLQLVLAAFVARLGFVFLAVAVPGLFVAIIKRLIGRARPFVSSMPDPYVYSPFAWRQEYASFPSGHAAAAFAAAVAVGALWPRMRPFMWGYALVIAISRMMVDAHYPSDVIGGAVAGTVGALLVRRWFAARRLGFAVDAAGRVHPLQGPSWRRAKQVARRLLGP